MKGQGHCDLACMNATSQEHLQGIISTLVQMFTSTHRIIGIWKSKVKVTVTLQDMFVVFRI